MLIGGIAMAEQVIKVTAEQQDTAHPYEEMLPRKTAWLFENVFREFGVRSTSEEEFGNMVHNFGQSNINGGRGDIAEAWSKFVIRKYIDVLEEDPAEGSEI